MTNLDKRSDDLVVASEVVGYALEDSFGLDHGKPDLDNGASEFALKLVLELDVDIVEDDAGLLLDTEAFVSDMMYSYEHLEVAPSNWQTLGRVGQHHEPDLEMAALQDSSAD